MGVGVLEEVCAAESVNDGVPCALSVRDCVTVEVGEARGDPVADIVVDVVSEGVDKAVGDVGGVAVPLTERDAVRGAVPVGDTVAGEVGDEVLVEVCVWVVERVTE